MEFEWDEQKNRGNRAKHGIGFESAMEVFRDPLAYWEQDRYVDGEERWQRIGLVDGHILVVVAHTIWEDENGSEIIRIISARRAQPRERKRYESA